MTIVQLVGTADAAVQLEEAFAVRIWAASAHRTGSVPVRYGQGAILQ